MFSSLKKYLLTSILISVPLMAMESKGPPAKEQKFNFCTKYSGFQPFIQQYVNPKYPFTSLFTKKIIELTTVTLDGHTDYITEAVFSPNGTALASASSDNTIKLWDTKSKKLITTLFSHTNRITSLAFNTDGTILASSSVDKTMLWETKNKRVITTTLFRHTSDINYINSVRFSPDGTILAAGCSDGDIILWDIKNKTLITTLRGHTNCVSSIAFSPDGTMLASASYDKTIKLWDVKTHTLINTLPGHTNYIKSIAFSPNGTMLASASEDETIKLWDTNKNTLITTLSGHNNLVNSVAFSPDGTMLASASGCFGCNTDVKLWDMQSKTLITTLSGHTHNVNFVTFSPDGAMLASASADNTIKLWDMQCISQIPKFLQSLSADQQGVKKFALLMAVFNHFAATKKPLNLSDPEVIATLKDLPIWLQKPLQEKQMVRVYLPKIKKINVDNRKEPFCALLDKDPSSKWKEVVEQEVKLESFVKTVEKVSNSSRDTIEPFLTTLYADVPGVKTYLLLDKILNQYEHSKEPLDIRQPEAKELFKELPEWLRKPLQDKQMVRLLVSKIKQINVENRNKPFSILLNKYPSPEWKNVVEQEVKLESFIKSVEEISSCSPDTIKPFLTTLYANEQGIKTFLLLDKILKQYEHRKEPLDIRQPEAKELFKNLPNWLRKPLRNKQTVRLFVPQIKKINIENRNEPYCILLDKDPLSKWKNAIKQEVELESFIKTVAKVSNKSRDIIEPFVTSLYADITGIKTYLLLDKILEHYEQEEQPLDIQQPEAKKLFKKLPEWLRKPLQDKKMVRKELFKGLPEWLRKPLEDKLLLRKYHKKEK